MFELFMELQSYTAKTFVGLEGVLEQELLALGAQNTQRRSRAVTFEGDQALLYRANFQLRTALRILCPLGTETVKTQEQLYAFAHRINWLRWFTTEQTFAIQANVFQAPAFNNSAFVALKVKDGLVDQFRRIRGSRPSVNKEQPDVLIDVFIYKDQCTISIDSSGPSLHRRGYRTSGHRAPLNEVLAAGMIQLSGWDGSHPLVDPFCGTGTLLTEAALIARNIAPNIKREDFGFRKWKNYDAKLWDKVWLACRADERRWEGQLIGSDISGKVVRFAQEQVKAAGVAPQITMSQQPFSEFEFPEAPFTMLSNPPYGERLDYHEIEPLYRDIGDRLKTDAAGAQAWILSSVPNFHRFIGLRPSERLRLNNGGLDCQFMQFELYTGSRREGGDNRSNRKEHLEKTNSSNRSQDTYKRPHRKPSDKPRYVKPQGPKGDKKHFDRKKKGSYDKSRSFKSKTNRPDKNTNPTSNKRWKEKRPDSPWKEERDPKPWNKDQALHKKDQEKKSWNKPKEDHPRKEHRKDLPPKSNNKPSSWDEEETFGEW